MLYMGTKPEPGTTSLHTTYAAYDAMIAAAAESNADLYTVDVTSEFNALGNPASLYQSDDLHLSEEGYVLWTKWVRNNANNAVPYHQNMLEATDEIIILSYRFTIIISGGVPFSSQLICCMLIVDGVVCIERQGKS